MAKTKKDPWAHLTQEQRACIHERALAQLEDDIMKDIDYRRDTLSQYIGEGDVGRAIECISDDKLEVVNRLGFDPATGHDGSAFVPGSLSPLEVAFLYYLTELALMEFPIKTAKASKKKKKGPVEPAQWEVRLTELVNGEPKIRKYDQIPGDVVDTVVNAVAEHIELRAKHKKKLDKQKAKEAAKLPPPAPPA